MKLKSIFYIFLLFIIIACSKNNEEPQNSNTSASTVLYVDTFRIYSTDLRGANRKLIVDEDIKSGNNYISGTAVLPVSGKIVYGYITGYQDPKTIKIVNADGSGKRVLKTFQVGTDIAYIKALNNDVIYYCTLTNQGANPVAKLFSIKADGSDEKEIPSFVNPYSFTAISKSGNEILSRNYFMKFKDGVFLEAESFNVFTVTETNENYIHLSLSPDGKKLAYIKKTAKDNEFDLMVRDVATRSGVSSKILTYTVPAELLQDAQFTGFFNLNWINSGDKILLSYGKHTSPNGSPNDFTQCELVDVVASKIGVSWKFMGDEAVVLVN